MFLLEKVELNYKTLNFVHQLHILYNSLGKLSFPSLSTLPGIHSIPGGYYILLSVTTAEVK